MNATARSSFIVLEVNKRQTNWTGHDVSVELRVRDTYSLSLAEILTLVGRRLGVNQLVDWVTVVVNNESLLPSDKKEEPT